MTSGGNINFDYLFKYIIIGDAAVGKSNLLLRYAHGQFKPEYQLTIGVEFGAKNIQIRGKTYRIQIWDTAGQENFRSITRAYYKNSACALVVYDISSRDSFNNVSTWIEDCKNQSPKSIHMILVGNKSDLADQRQVNTEEGQELADKYGMQFFETSAKTGENVEQIFFSSADEIAKKIEDGSIDLEGENGIKKGNLSQNARAPVQLNERGIQPQQGGNNSPCC
jgi:small GTP-binding protein